MRIKPFFLSAVLFAGATGVAHAGVTVSGAAIASVDVSSMNVTWLSTNTATGFIVYASTAANFSPLASGVFASSPIFSSATLTGLMPNTTYFAEVGGISAGTTNYAVTFPSSTATLASALAGTQISQVTGTSVTATWVAFTSGGGPNTGSGYSLQISTASDFTGSIFMSSTTNISLSTLTISGLPGSTTFYIRAGAFNWNFIPNYALLGTAYTVNPTIPTGLAGTALGVSSISWTWGTVSGASAYDLYDAAAPATVIVAGVVTNSFVETNLSTNTPYGRVVDAVVSGSSSSLSNGATAYTLAAVPKTPLFVSTFTLTWSANGNPGYTPYEVSLSTNNFATVFSVPVPFSAAFTGNTTSFVGLTPGPTYYARVRAQNGDAIATLFSTIASTVSSGGAAPTSPILAGVSVNSLTATWGSVSSIGGYILEVSTYCGFDGTLTSSTINGSATTLTILGLNANTTYCAQVGALWPGTTSYAVTSPSLSVTLSPAVTGVFFNQTASSTINIGWNALSSTETIGYTVQASTAANFGGTLFSVGAPGFASNSATVSGLSAATTYFVRIGSLNSSSVPNYATVGSTFTANGATLSAPTGLIGTAAGPASITWTWNLVSGATGYHVYQATSPATLVGTVTVATFTESGLQPNTAYGRVVSAGGSGQESALSASATTYTLANTPTVPSFSTVGVSSFTMTWGAAGNPGSTVYEVSLALNSGFSVGVTTPVPFTASLTANTTAVIGLSAGTSYWVRVRAQNGNAIATSFGTAASTSTISLATSTAVTGGLGSAFVTPSTGVPEGSIVVATVTYVVPSGGLNTGAQIQVTLPFNWGPQLNPILGANGYTVQTGTAGVFSLSYSSASPSVTATYTDVSNLPAGTAVVFWIRDIYTNCPTPNQTNAVWTVKASLGNGFTPSVLTTPVLQSLTAGTFQRLGYNPWNALNMITNQRSNAIVLQATDNCQQPVLVPSSTTVTLSAYLPNQTTLDPNAHFYASSTSVTVNSVVIATGSSTAFFYYQSSSTQGNNYWIRGDYSLPGNANPFQIWRSLNILGSAPTFSNASVDTGAVSIGQKSITLSPDGSGTNNLAYIRFFPSDFSQQWHVTISSSNFQNIVFERWGSGDPQSTIAWDGRIQPGNLIAPNGVYTVKIEYPGITADTSVSITLNTAQISGTVSVIGTGLVSGAQITAFGSNNPGYSSAVSDASGAYTLYGLRAGFQYNLNAIYINPTNQSAATQQFSNVIASASPTTRNFSLSSPATIRVSGVAGSAAAASVYGSININSTDYSKNYFGNLRLLPGTTTTDNGDSFNPSTWTVFYVQPGSTYTLNVNMQGYGTSGPLAPFSVTTSTDIIVSLVSQASISGQIILPSSVTFPTQVSINGTPAGSNTPTVWGGASFNANSNTASYTLNAVSSGTYTLTAQVNGYTPSIRTSVVVGTVPLTGIDFSTVTLGGVIAGSVTINGDTSGMVSPIVLYMNAYSQQLGYNVSTQVQLATSSTRTTAFYQIGGAGNGPYQMYAPYLQGFDPGTFGPTAVNVSGNPGSGSAYFTLTRQTGEIDAAVTLPPSKFDYPNVHLSVQGQANIEMDLTAATTSIFHLGTGFFNITATYKTTGAQVQTTVNLTNGQTASVPLDLSVSTYAVTGTVSVQTGFSVKGSTTGTPVTVTTIADLLGSATTQALYIGGVSGTMGGNGLDCSQTVPVTTTTARVEAFPKYFNSFGDSNRTGLTNCFRLGQYHYGAINLDGTYVIPNLTPGVWEIDVYPYFDNGQAPNAAAQKQTITIAGANATGVDFALTGGNAVAGTVNLPSGVTDNRSFSAQVIDSKGNTIQTTTLVLGAAGAPVSSVDYQFTNLPGGQYSLLVQDLQTLDTALQQYVIKYVASPIQFTINGADVSGVNVTMGRAARIIGSLGIQTVNSLGTTSLTLITQSNSSLLPSNYQIMAQANPWIPGGSQSAQFSQNGTGPAIDANNHFTIDGLAPGTYDVNFQQSSFGASVQAAGSINLASYTQGSVVVTQGQTVDLGVITIKPGLSLSGTVADASGHPISNITVRATPSTTQHGQNSIEVTSDAQGNFTLAGLSPDLRVYDIVAAPRPGAGDSTPLVPYAQVKRLAVDVTKAVTPPLNFSLASATARFTGTVQTADHGSLSYPDSDQIGFPEAAIFFHLEGTNTDDNPLGQEAATNLDGTFTVPNLAAGIYDLTIESLGYKPYRIPSVTLAAGATQDLGAILLQKGPEVDATLAKPDGSLVNTGQVQTVVAVTADLTSIIFGQVSKDASTGNILSVKFSGFELSPKTYNILFFDNQNNITIPPEGKNLTFTSNTDVISRALTYQQSAPFAFTDAKRSGTTAMSVTYYISRPLRSRGDDQDPSQWLTITSGQGSLSNIALSGDRRQLTVVYNPAPGEQNATLAFNSHTVDMDPSTGVEFVISKSVTLLLGQKATSESNINPALGGSVSLATSNDPSNVSVPSNALLASGGTQADASVSYNVTFTATDDLTSAGAGTAHSARAMALDTLMARGSAAYVSEAYLAMQTARKNLSASHAASVAVDPFSSFYSVLLPAGISHSLNQNATLTLTYDTDADPTLLNVYYFNGTEYLIENNSRVIDAVNHTISVGVSHFSTFVVLQNASPVILVTGDAATNADVSVFNFPNPFNLQSKPITLNHDSSGTGPTSTNGTIIRYIIPASKAGAAHIDIYNVVGEKVRSIDLGAPAADAYHYVEWDGKNNSGNNVASGVYIGILKVGGTKKTWKMAVIK